MGRKVGVREKATKTRWRRWVLRPRGTRKHGKQKAPPARERSSVEGDKLSINKKQAK